MDRYLEDERLALAEVESILTRLGSPSLGAEERLRLVVLFQRPRLAQAYLLLSCRRLPKKTPEDAKLRRDICSMVQYESSRKATWEHMDLIRSLQQLHMAPISPHRWLGLRGATREALIEMNSYLLERSLDRVKLDGIPLVRVHRLGPTSKREILYEQPGAAAALIRRDMSALLKARDSFMSLGNRETNVLLSRPPDQIVEMAEAVASLMSDEISGRIQLTTMPPEAERLVREHVGDLMCNGLEESAWPLISWWLVNRGPLTLAGDDRWKVDVREWMRLCEQKLALVSIREGLVAGFVRRDGDRAVGTRVFEFL